MIVSLCISGATCILMICSVLFFPKLKFGKHSVESYWVITLLGACVLLLCCVFRSDFDLLRSVGESLVADTAINPLKILVLFLSMTVLSIFLDEFGLFRYLANAVLRRAKSGQMRLFLYLYLLVSVLTVFTSNDVIILSFTPLICYFAKHAGVHPIPYLAGEFVAANTWSMALVIGNPTNIYLAAANGLDFAAYFELSILPTLAAGAVAFLALLLLFRKQLSAPLTGEAETIVIEDKLCLGIGLAHLGICTVFLAIGSYFGVEMWLVSLCAVVSLFLCTGVVFLVRRKPPAVLLGCVKRIPYPLVPFVLSMFVMIVVLSEQGVTAQIGAWFGTDCTVLKYGVASFLAANLINNIPMSVLFSSILASVSESVALPAVMATVIGSNLGAFFTPIGALAGILWSHILHRYSLKFGYLDFLKIGVTVALPTLAAALGVLWLELLV